MKFSKLPLFYFSLSFIVTIITDAMAGPFDDVFLKSPGSHNPDRYFNIIKNGHFTQAWNDFTESKEAKFLALKQNDRLDAAYCLTRSYHDLIMQNEIHNNTHAATDLSGRTWAATQLLTEDSIKVRGVATHATNWRYIVTALTEGFDLAALLAEQPAEKTLDSITSNLQQNFNVNREGKITSLEQLNANAEEKLRFQLFAIALWGYQAVADSVEDALRTRYPAFTTIIDNLDKIVAPYKQRINQLIEKFKASAPLGKVLRAIYADPKQIRLSVDVDEDRDVMRKRLAKISFSFSSPGGIAPHMGALFGGTQMLPLHLSIPHMKTSSKWNSFSRVQKIQPFFSVTTASPAFSPNAKSIPFSSSFDMCMSSLLSPGSGSLTAATYIGVPPVISSPPFMPLPVSTVMTLQHPPSTSQDVKEEDEEEFHVIDENQLPSVQPEV